MSHTSLLLAGWIGLATASTGWAQVPPPTPITTLTSVYQDVNLRSVHLVWAAPSAFGDIGGVVSSYELRYSTSGLIADESFGSATIADAIIDAPLEAGALQNAYVISLQPGTAYSFRLKAVNGAGLAVLSNSCEFMTPTEGPPDLVTDLAAEITYVDELGGNFDVRYSWSKPVGATAYYLSYAPAPILTMDLWSMAQAAPVNNLQRVPYTAATGTRQYHTITFPMDERSYYAAVRSENTNYVSGLSNTVAADSLPPLPVQDLSAVQLTESSALLTWTSPGDAIGSPRPVAAFDLRWSTGGVVDAAAYPSATPLDGEPETTEAGRVESMVVEGLQPGVQAWFALTSVDWSGNRSAISNSADVMIVEAVEEIAPPPVVAVDGSAGTSSRCSGSAAASPWIIALLLPLIGLRVRCLALVVLLAAAGPAWGQAVVSTADADTIPPAAITDLSAVSTGTNSILLTWTAPGDDGMIGTVTSIYVKMSTSPITEATYDSSQFVALGNRTPTAAGSIETLDVRSPLAVFDPLRPSTVYYFAVKTHDGTNFSPLSNIASARTDADPVTIVQDLRSSDVSTETSITVEWTTNPGIASHDLRYRVESGSFPADDAIYATAFRVPAASISVSGSRATGTVTGLPRGTAVAFRLRAYDATGGWSYSNEVSDNTQDRTPPSAIRDLSATYDGQQIVSMDRLSPVVLLRWTAPGNDGDSGRAAGYRIRYSQAPIVDEASWDASSPVIEAPMNPPAGGCSDSFRVARAFAPDRRWHFAVRAVDNSGNLGGISNATSLELGDTVAPERVLTLTATAVPGGVELAWVTSGDDGIVGRAAAFDIRHSGRVLGNRRVIVDETPRDDYLGDAPDRDFLWADPVHGEPLPGEAGFHHSFIVTGLPERECHFAIRVIDEAGNVSRLSNAASAMPLPPPPPPSPSPVESRRSSSSGGGCHAGSAGLSFLGLALAAAAAAIRR